MANNKIQTAVQQNKPEARAKQGVNAMLNSVLDGEGMRRRFDELLGKRTPQFMSCLVSMINDNQALQEAFCESPMSVIKSALQAASYDLPIDPALGYAYIVPFKVKGKVTATFVIGYKGMTQLCLRTGAYKIVPDAVDVREGELVSYNRLTGEAVFNWIEDEDEREKRPIVGYAGYFQLKNGAEKTIYMSKKQIDAHEKKNRKGDNMGKGWRDDYGAMARKTVIRRLCGKYALMSIEYQNSADRDTMNLANALAAQDYPDEQADVILTDAETGEVVAEPEALPGNGYGEGLPDFLTEDDNERV